MTLTVLGNTSVPPNCVLNNAVTQRCCISSPRCYEYFCKDCPGIKLLSDTNTVHIVGMTDLKGKKKDEGVSLTFLQNIKQDEDRS